jgi:hypothetical protein
VKFKSGNPGIMGRSFCLPDNLRNLRTALKRVR